MTTADAFYHYYLHFNEAEHHFESHIGRLKTPVKVIWGEKDFYINQQMGEKLGGSLTLLPAIGHYPHLQDPAITVREVRPAFH